MLFYSLEMLKETFPILSPIEPYVINIYRSSCKVPIIMFECKLNLNFLDGFLKHFLVRNFMKTFQWEPRFSMYTDRQSDRQTSRQTEKLTDLETDRRTNGRTDRDREVNSSIFRNFANVPINYGGTGQSG